jgi:hypothetical protein
VRHPYKTTASCFWITTNFETTLADLLESLTFFEGIEGTIKRINKNKRVVVQSEGVAAVAIAFVPANCLKLL